MTPQQTVFVVDDDPAVLESLRKLITGTGHPVRTFATAGEFLDVYRPEQGGCLLLDVRMPGQSGLEVQRELAARGATIPIIIITGFADVHVAVRALKEGAMDFIEKPFSNQLLLDRVEDALERDRRERQEHGRHAAYAERVARLTRREREVMDRVVTGKSNREIAGELGLSLKTVEGHRARVMEKMEADSLADLIRFVLTSEASGRPAGG